MLDDWPEAQHRRFVYAHQVGLDPLPRVTDSGSFLDEFTCVVAEYNDDMRIVKYTKPDDRRDDALQACDYAEMVAMRLLGTQRR